VTVPYLDDATVRRLLGGVDLRPALAETVLRMQQGEVEMAPRVSVGGGSLGQVTQLMMARDHVRQRVVTKLVDYDPTRPDRLGRPSNVGLVTYMVGADVVFTASAAEFTTIRTSACTAFALDLLAPPDAGVLSVLGAGPQAEEHVRQFARLRQLQTVRVASRSAPRAARLVARLQLALAPASVQLSENLDAACAGADVVIAATSTVEPVLFPRHIHSGLVLALIGSGIPARREANGEVMAAAARIVVETQQAAWDEAGDLLIAEREGLLDRSRTTELVTLLGSAVPPVSAGYIIYKSVGSAWEDLACAAVLAGLSGV
jgi:ornithine cyclodeaminase/alanine dehydrogenase-like protein (mu-crystallin family)